MPKEFASYVYIVLGKKSRKRVVFACQKQIRLQNRINNLNDFRQLNSRHVHVGSFQFEAQGVRLIKGKTDIYVCLINCKRFVECQWPIRD